jgi:hypothetical protein
MIEEQAFSLINQLPPLMAIIIFILGVAVYFLRKDLKDEKETIKTNNTAHSLQIDSITNLNKDSIEKIIKEYKEEIKELNEYVRVREATQTETMRDYVTINEEIEKKQQEIIDLLNKR